LPDALGQSTTQAIGSPVCTGNCDAIKVGPVVPPSSQEPDPQQTDVNGNRANEEIWADFFTTTGSIDDTRLLYDSTTGSVGDPSITDAHFNPPGTAATGTIWAVVHDDRGGASWVTIPVNVQ
jgi:hypothetical protein